MTYRNFIITLIVSLNTSTCIVSHNESTHKYFLHKLTVCCYSSHCIAYLRHRHPQEIHIINALLEHHYRSEYQNAIAQLHSKKEKLRLLEEIEDHLIRELYWIEHGCGCEPYILRTNDGTDRGIEGLRLKVLKKVMKEVDQKDNDQNDNKP